ASKPAAWVIARRESARLYWAPGNRGEGATLRPVGWTAGAALAGIAAVAFRYPRRLATGRHTESGKREAALRLRSAAGGARHRRAHQSACKRTAWCAWPAGRQCVRHPGGLAALSAGHQRRAGLRGT